LRRRYSTALGIAAAVVALDLITKRYAAVHFVGAPTRLMGDFLNFSYTENPGAAFSMFQTGGPVLGLAAVAIVIVILIALRRENPTMEVVAYGFVIGGALGNFADRLFRADGFLDGNVIDWINLGPIPTFNLADTSITVAVVLLLIDALRRR
jgi:signal peptidase II